MRLVAASWLFVVVIVATWSGLLSTGEETLAEGNPAIDEPAISRVLDALDAIGASTNPALGSGAAPTAAPCPPFTDVGARFGADQVEVTPAGEQTLLALVTVLRAAPCLTDPLGTTCAGHEAEVEVTGHSDDAPTSRPGGNQRLSLERAWAVTRWLQAWGITVRTVGGSGSSQPTTPSADDDRSADERRADDRRVTVTGWCPRPES
jgi:outer membrane protein OmpA-like peptidoglycan-associated protein